MEEPTATCDRFLVDRHDLGHEQWVRKPIQPDNGEIVVAIERFALTSNNVTYARTGDQFGYWAFYPAEEPLGAVPVWGAGTVAYSRCADLPEGERVYGFFPIASHAVLRPHHVRAHAFIDGSPHRAKLPATYNEYVRLDADRTDDPAVADLHLVLRPLFALAFFIHAYLVRNSFFGASTVLVSSASSKASLALAALLEGAPVRTVGLTSAANRAFVDRTMLYGETSAYDALSEGTADGSVVFVDIAGNTDVVSAVHRHYGDRLVKSIRAGFTHGLPDTPSELPGPPPELFFTPDHILATRDEWGADVLRKSLLAAQARVYAALKHILKMRHAAGTDAVARVWADLLAGRVAPEDAWILSVRPPMP